MFTFHIDMKISYACFFFLSGLLFSDASYGREYFQQEVNYKINVSLDDKKHELSGFEQIEYINRSPDDLDFIYFHLWANGYKDNSTELAKQLLDNGELKFYHSKPKNRGFVDSLNFIVDGYKVKIEYDSIHLDICKLILPQILHPGDTARITTSFHVKIPKGVFSRLGHLGESYQITQWYPKPAVYDFDGWHPIPYLNQGEFYSEFGSYDVNISLPKNYVVGATGDLTDCDFELRWLEEKVKETKDWIEKDLDSIVKPYSAKPAPDMSFPVSDSTIKTLHFFLRNVHDFAWFADKRYHVLKGEVELPHTKRKVTTWTMFTNLEKNLWKKSIEYVNDAVYYYSEWNGDYPYNQATAVDGALSAGGGMEYPNITVIGKSGSAYSLENVIAHEVGHNWFYGILGSNERDHAWMDEGINSFYENRYMNKKFPPEKSKTTATISGLGTLGNFFNLGSITNSTLLETAYQMNARRKLDQPIELSSADFTEINYGGIVYEKTALVFEYLNVYLGEETFDRCMKKYFETWKFKHPQPEDLKKIFIRETGKDLEWFFDDLLQTTKQIDYKIISSKKCQEACDGVSYAITLKNTGEILSPVSVSSVKNNKILSTFWMEGFSGKQKVSFTDSAVDFFRIDYSKNIPEVNRRNNSSRADGLFRKADKIQFKLLGGFENPYKTQIYFLPLIGWNNYDKTLLGMAFYNSLIPQKKFEYVLAPFYGIRSKNVNGFFDVGYNAYPSGDVLQNIRLGVVCKKFTTDNYPQDLSTSKIAPEICFTFRKPFARSHVNQNLRIRNVNIISQRPYYSYLENKSLLYNSAYSLNEFSYHLTNNRKLNPYSATVAMQGSEGFLKGWAELNFNFSFKKTKGIDIRFFSGKFFDGSDSGRFPFSLTGNNDYLFDALYLGRNETEGLLSKQMIVQEGGFKNNYSHPSSYEWMTTVNIMASLPWKSPFRLYGDFGVSENSQSPEYDAGIAFMAIPGIFEVYVPLAMAKELDKNSIAEKIRFTLNLHLLNPLALMHSSVQ